MESESSSSDSESSPRYHTLQAPAFHFGPLAPPPCSVAPPCRVAPHCSTPPCSTPPYRVAPPCSTPPASRYPSIQSILSVTGTVDIEQFNQGFDRDSRSFGAGAGEQPTREQLAGELPPPDSCTVVSEVRRRKRPGQGGSKAAKVQRCDQATEEQEGSAGIDESNSTRRSEESLDEDLSREEGGRPRISKWHRIQLVLYRLRMDQRRLSELGLRGERMTN